MLLGLADSHLLNPLIQNRARCIVACQDPFFEGSYCERDAGAGCQQTNVS